MNKIISDNDVYKRFRNYDKEFISATSEILFPPEIYEEIKRCLQGAILDIGTGDGNKLESILKKCGMNKIESLIAIDPSPLYKIAQKRLEKYSIKVKNCSLEDFESPILFDTIFLFDVIEHSYYPDEMIKKIVTLLKDNGVLIMSTPNRPIYNLTEKIIKGRLDPTHVSVMNLNEIKKLMNTYFYETKILGVLPIMKIGRRVPLILRMHKFIKVSFFYNNVICFSRNPRRI
jgi:SAM-dependent methyltransferase